MGRIGKLAIAVALSLGPLQAFAVPTDSACVQSGKMGQDIVGLKQKGFTEKELVDMVAPDPYMKDGPERLRNEKFFEFAKKLVAYVYTMDPKPENVRKTIYLKCKAGDFD